jgi:hypothetical protein
MEECWVSAFIPRQDSGRQDPGVRTPDDASRLNGPFSGGSREIRFRRSGDKGSSGMRISPAALRVLGFGEVSE